MPPVDREDRIHVLLKEVKSRRVLPAVKMANKITRLQSQINNLERKERKEEKRRSENTIQLE